MPPCSGALLFIVCTQGPAHHGPHKSQSWRNQITRNGSRRIQDAPHSTPAQGRPSSARTPGRPASPPQGPPLGLSWGP